MIPFYVESSELQCNRDADGVPRLRSKDVPTSLEYANTQQASICLKKDRNKCKDARLSTNNLDMHNNTWLLPMQLVVKQCRWGTTCWAALH